jgi:hypothetical protein
VPFRVLLSNVSDSELFWCEFLFFFHILRTNKGLSQTGRLGELLPSRQRGSPGFSFLYPRNWYFKNVREKVVA